MRSTENRSEENKAIEMLPIQKFVAYKPLSLNPLVMPSLELKTLNPLVIPSLELKNFPFKKSLLVYPLRGSTENRTPKNETFPDVLWLKTADYLDTNSLVIFILTSKKFYNLGSNLSLNNRLHQGYIHSLFNKNYLTSHAAKQIRSLIPTSDTVQANTILTPIVPTNLYNDNPDGTGFIMR